MKAVILAAGFGSRLKPMTDTIPKVMVPIGGKPLLLWHVEYLKRYAITDIYINLHYKPEKIRTFFGDGHGFGVHITYSYEPIIRGTAGALGAFGRYLTDRFILLYGDVFTNINLDRFSEYHREKNALVSAVVHHTHHPRDSDLVEVSTRGKITKLMFKPHGRESMKPLSLGAMYICESDVIPLVPKKIPSDFTHNVLPVVMRSKKSLYAYSTDEYMMDIGTPERLARVAAFTATIA